MSTRYVWGRYSVLYPALDVSGKEEFRPGTPNGTFLVCSTYTREIEGDYIKIKPGGNIKSYAYSYSSSFTIPCSEYRYLIPNPSGGVADQSALYSQVLDSNGNGSWQITKVSGYPVIKNVINSSEAISFVCYTAGQSVSEIGKGNFISNVSSSDSTKHPQSGIDGSYYYEYKGSDTIDPISLTYSKEEVDPGDSIDLILTPRAATYGGDIRYLYQYSSGGSWSNLFSNTTDVKVSTSIPSTATQYRARVLASDKWGFTSTTYVYGPTLAVSLLKAYATINGVHRAISKAYPTVDGKFRALSKGYVTIGGVWKKLF